ncbi:MAG: replication initiation protein [Ruminococcus sp.]|nr:replication initiation protein [Ruminococcus sp.]
MPKRKTLPSIPDYTGNVKNLDKLLIQKSNPLQSLSQTSMTLPELKILDAYLSRINSHEPDKRYVRFEKGELEKLLGVTRMHREELSKRVKNLFQAVEVYDERKPNGFICISLFSKAECLQDKNGLWQINLVCSEEAMEYIFNIENLGYLKYRLKNVINLTSRYSYILYLCLEDNLKILNNKKWIVDLNELKKMLKCTGDSYEQFKVFNDRVLKLCQKEINKKTTINFTYTPIKKGRKVVAVEFDIKKSQEIKINNENPELKELPVAYNHIDEPNPEQIPLSVYNEELDEASIKHYESFDRYSDDNIRFLAESCGYEFNESQMKEIYDIISTMNLPYHPYGKELSQYDYLFDQYIKLNQYTENKGMDDKRRFSYFRRMLENDKHNY